MSMLAESLSKTGMPDLKISKGNAAYHTLKSAILLSELEPEKAIGEQLVAGQLGCSQGTVREALLRLQYDGLVQRRGYRGTFVSRTTMTEAAEMAMIRIRLESEGIRRAQKTFDDGRRRVLVNILEQMEAANDAGDFYSLSEIDRLFHTTLFEAAEMPILEPVLSRCILHMHRYTYVNRPERKTGISPKTAHAPIMRALSFGDPDAAAQAAKNHIENVLGRWSPELLKKIRSQAENKDQSQIWSPA